MSHLRTEVNNQLYRIKGGMLPSKLIFGIPTYARTWTVSKEVLNGIPPYTTKQEGNPGPTTKKTGLLSYSEVCTRLPNKKNGNPQNPLNSTSKATENLNAG